MSDEKESVKQGFNASCVFYGAVVFLCFSFLLVYLIDIANVFGLGELIASKSGEGGFVVPFFWYYWFLIPVEIPLQWYILGCTLCVFSLNAGRAYEHDDKRIFNFWLLIGAGVLFMLVEDAGDVRHHLHSLLVNAFSQTGYGILGIGFELTYFATIALIMLVAIIKYRDVFWAKVKARNYFILAYILYGIGVFSSFAANASPRLIGTCLYRLAGRFFMENVFIAGNERLATLYYKANEARGAVDYMFMDRVFEESVEFLGAAALLTAGIAFFVEYKRRNGRSEAEKVEDPRGR